MSSSLPTTPSNTELERAIAAVPGVEAAYVDRMQGTGRSRLRIRVANGEDAPTVSWAVAATLRERFGIVLDPADIKPRVDTTVATDGQSATSATDEGALAELHAITGHASPTANGGTNGGISVNGRRGVESRAAVRNLDTRVEVSDVVVTVTLGHGDREQVGRARSVPTQQGLLRAVAEATVDAMRGLTGGRLVAGVDRVAATVGGEPAIATVVVSVVAGGHEENLLGASLVRDDPPRAVMRATLDALNRRVEHWLVAEVTTSG